MDIYCNHIILVYLFSGVPEPPRLCELRNDSSLEVVCQPGNDGGLQQHFVLEAVSVQYLNNLESTRSPQNTIDNEISTMNDQVRIFLLSLTISGSFNMEDGKFSKPTEKRNNFAKRLCTHPAFMFE